MVITTLDATLAGDGDAVIEDMRGSVIFTARPTAESELPLGRLDEESPTMAMSVEFLASRCDVHAVAESKKTFQIPVWISAAGYNTQFVTIEPTGDLRDELQDLIQTCLEDSADG